MSVNFQNFSIRKLNQNNKTQSKYLRWTKKIAHFHDFSQWEPTLVFAELKNFQIGEDVQ